MRGLIEALAPWARTSGAPARRVPAGRDPRLRPPWPSDRDRRQREQPDFLRPADGGAARGRPHHRHAGGQPAPALRHHDPPARWGNSAFPMPIAAPNPWSIRSRPEPTARRGPTPSNPTQRPRATSCVAPRDQRLHLAPEPAGSGPGPAGRHPVHRGAGKGRHLSELSLQGHQGPDRAGHTPQGRGVGFPRILRHLPHAGRAGPPPRGARPPSPASPIPGSRRPTASATMAKELRKLGQQVFETEDSLEIEPRPLRGRTSRSKSKPTATTGSP